MIIQPANRVSGVKQYYFARKLAEIADMQKAGRKIINLGIGSPDLPPAPQVLAALNTAAQAPDANKYQSYRGLPELRDAFANWYDKKFGVSLDGSSEVLPLIGSKEGIVHISMSFLDPGDVVLVPNPGYPAYATAATLAGATVKYFDLTAANNWLPDLSALAAEDLSKVKLMWLNYPNMPTGASANKAFFEELVVFAKANEILLVHDNPYAFILNNEPLSLLSVSGATEVALELNSLSKCFNMAGWRVGALFGSSEYLNEVMKFKSNMDSGMYKAVQLAAVEALALGDDWYAGLNETYSERREVVWEMMEALGAEIDKKATGLFVWGRLPETVGGSEALVEALLEATGVFITPGFIFGSNGAPYVRIALCSPVETLLVARDLIINWRKTS